MVEMKSILKQVNENEIIVLVSDKCKKLCISSKEAYERMGGEHVDKCRIINHEEVVEITKVLNGTSKLFMNIFNVGMMDLKLVKWDSKVL